MKGILMKRLSKIVLSALVSISLINKTDALVDLSNAKANSVLVQSNGQIVASGVANIGGVVQGIIVRYNSNGTLDNTFGTNGVVTTVIGDNGTFNTVFQQSDGKLVVGGSAGLTTNPQYIVARYNADGSLDTNFGNQGVVTSILSSSTSSVNAIAQQTNGQLIIVGTANSATFIPRIFVARLNGNGTFDNTFGSSGVTFTTFGNFASGVSVAIQPADGKIVVGGSSQTSFLAARYTTAGVLDTTFGNSGIFTYNFLGSIAASTSLLIQSDGKIVQGGFSDSNFAVARLTTAGALDVTFGVNGRVTTPFATSAEIFDLVLQSDGKIVAAGYMDNQIALARYTTTGALDATYGTGGLVTTQVGAMARALSAAYESSDGKVVIAGYSSPNLIVSRYNTNGTVDNTFGVVSSPVVCGTALCAYAQIYNVSQVDILNNNPFTFDSNGTSLNVTHTTGSSNITIGQDGTYLIEYIINANSPAFIQLLQNGNSVAAATYVTQSGTTVGSAIISAKNGDVLSLINLSGYDIFLVGGAVNACVTLAKIA